MKRIALLIASLLFMMGHAHAETSETTVTLLKPRAKVSLPTAATPVKKTKPNVYVFEGLVIDGIIARPSFMGFNLRGKVAFGRLSHLAISFRKSLLDTGREGLFR